MADKSVEKPYAARVRRTTKPVPVLRVVPVTAATAAIIGARMTIAAAVMAMIRVPDAAGKADRQEEER